MPDLTSGSRRALLVGMGVTNRAVAGALLRRGHEVVAVDVNGEALEPGKPRALAHLDRVTLGEDLEFVIMELARVPLSDSV